MARVCVGCGLTTDADGLLILNLPDAWPFACDLEDFGGNLYCSPVDGIIRTSPPDLCRTNSNTGGVSPPDPITIDEDDVDVVDTIDITLTNPSTCYSARAFVMFEGDVHVILDPGDAFTMFLDGNRYARLGNSGSVDLNTVSFQLARGQTYLLTPGQVLPVSIPISVEASGGDIEYTNVNWRVTSIIVATQ